MMWFLTITTIVFGILTIVSGGQVLFGDEKYQTQAGNYIPFVVWFNFIAGFFYILAGLGLLLQRRLSVILPWTLALMNLFVFIAFANYIRLDGLYEMRTVYAMSIRLVLWSFVSVFVYKKFWRVK